MPRRRDPFEPLFRALGHTGRRRLLDALAQRGGLTLGELSDELPMTRQATSQHLALLEQAGLVVTRWRGREKLHFLNPTPLLEAWQGWVELLVTQPALSLASLREALESGGSDSARRGGASA